MRKHLFLIISILLLLSLYFSAYAATDLFFVNVGKGDAIIIRDGDHDYLIDTGKKSAENAIRSAFDRLGINRLHAVFLTHGDSDHCGGVKWLKSFPVDAVYTSEFSAKNGKGKHPAEKLANAVDSECARLRAGDSIPLSENSFLHVLAPSVASEDEDNNSLVMMLDTPDGRVLLTGDMELEETYLLLDTNADLSCDVLKVPNHGDDDACPYALITKASPRYAIISTNSEEKPDTPSDRVLSDLDSVDCETYVTQDSIDGIAVHMDNGTITITPM